MSQLPLLFEQNNGQANDAVRFQARMTGAKVLLLEDGMIFRPSGQKPSDIELKFVSAQQNRAPTGEDEATAKINYFAGVDPSKYLRNIPTYQRVKYSALYSGIDLIAYGNGPRFEFDLNLAPGANLSEFGLEVSGADVSVNSDGSLRLGSEFSLQVPSAFQQDSKGVRKSVRVHYGVKGNRVSLVAENYDSHLGLTIDPQLISTYSTWLSSSVGSTIYAVAVDGSGNTYVAGIDANSTDFPTKNPLESTGTTFVSKLNPTGTALIYSTYVAGGSALPGGTGTQSGPGGHSLAVDPSGNAYLVGTTTYNDNFPVTANAYPTPPPFSNSEAVGFLLKLSADGSQIPYATFVGGYTTVPQGVAVDSSGVAYVAGTAPPITFSTTANAYQPTATTASVVDAFLSKFDTNQSGVSSLPYSTYFGVFGVSGTDVACDNAGNAYLLGSTLVVSTGHGGVASGTIVTRNAFQATAPGNGDVFVAQFNTLASGDASLVTASYLGGTGRDVGTSIAVDSSSNVYVTGTTASGDFTPNPAAAERNCKAFCSVRKMVSS